MDTKLIHKTLKELGYKDTEISIYILCYNNFLKVSEIAKLSRIKRTNVYAIVNKLLTNGLLKEIPHPTYKQFISISIARLSDVLNTKREKKLKLINRNIEKIQKLKEQFNVTTSPDMKIFSGYIEASKLYKKVRKTTNLKIITGILRYANAPDLIDEINDKAIKIFKNKKIKIIIPDTQKSRDIINYQKTKNPDHFKIREFKFINFHKIPIENELILTKTKAYVFSFTEKATWAIEYKDKLIINFYRGIFESLWNK